MEVNHLHEWAGTQHGIMWIKSGTPEIVPWEVKPDGKYWRGYLPKEEIKLDLFLTTPEQWGIIYLIRTGSAEFSQAVVTHAKRVPGRYVDGGRLHISGVPVEVREEDDVFRLLDLAYVSPQGRSDGRCLRRRMKP